MVDVRTAKRVIQHRRGNQNAHHATAHAREQPELCRSACPFQVCVLLFGETSSHQSLSSLSGPPELTAPQKQQKNFVAPWSVANLWLSLMMLLTEVSSVATARFGLLCLRFTVAPFRGDRDRRCDEHRVWRLLFLPSHLSGSSKSAKGMMGTSSGKRMWFAPTRERGVCRSVSRVC